MMKSLGRLAEAASYEVELPGGLPARCNPVNAPAICRSGGLE